MCRHCDFLQSLTKCRPSGQEIDQSHVLLTVEELVKARPAQVRRHERNVLACSRQHHPEPTKEEQDAGIVPEPVKESGDWTVEALTPQLEPKVAEVLMAKLNG